MPCPQPKASTHVPGPSNSPVSELMRDAAFKLTDQVEHLVMTQQAFLAVERLLAPSCGCYLSEKLELDRSELSSLFGTLNRSFRLDLAEAQSLSENVRFLVQGAKPA